MLGYVMDGNVARAHLAVFKAIKAKKLALLLTPDGGYRNSALQKNHKWHGETRHSFPDGRFTVYHLLVPVRWD
jgi:hypothetical protein